MLGLAMTQYAVRSLALLGAVAALAGGCGQVTMGKGKKILLGTVDEQFQPEGNLEELRIVNSSGDVDVVSARGASIEIEARVKVAESRLDEFDREKALTFNDHISVRQEGGLLVVEDAHRHDPDHNDWQLELTIRVPRQVSIKATLGAGNVSIKLAAARDIDVNLGAGNVEIDLQRIDGGVMGRVGAGNFALSTTVSAPTKDVEIDCAAGNISLALPKQFSGVFDVTVAVGEVSIAERYGLHVNRKLMTAYVKGTVGTGGPRYKLQVATGAINLK